MPATAPLAGDVHVNKPLTNFAQRFLQNAATFIGTRAFPNVPVAKQSDLYYVFDKEDFMRDEAEERADGTESAGGSFSLSTDPYFCRVWAFHKDLSDRQRDNQDDQVKLEQSATAFVMGKMLLKREVQFVQKLFTAAVWNAHTPVNVDWSDAASGPIKDIRDGKRAVQLATGLRPNRMLIGRTGYDTLLENDEILGRVMGGATTAVAAAVQKQLLTQLLELDEILIMDSIINQGVKGGATQTKAFIGTDDALLYYAPMSLGAEEPTAGVQFSWNGFRGATDNGARMKKFRMENIESDRIEAQMAFDYKCTSPELGIFFTSVSTA